jgi:hypothetical protein
MGALGLWMAVVAVLVTAPSTGAAQADVSGTWELTVMTDQGDQMLTITVIQDGQNLSATGDAGEFGSIEMTGTIDGVNVRLAWELDLQGTPLDIVFTGVLADGVISGSADFGGMGEGEWTAKRSSGRRSEWTDDLSGHTDHGLLTQALRP